MKLSAKATAALSRVVARFERGDLSPVVKLAGVGLDTNAPMSRWSWGNRFLAVAQTGDLDVRGYRQWRQVGRQVREGEKAAFILRPQTRTILDDDGEVERQWVQFRGQAVFGLGQTDPIPGWDGDTFEVADPVADLPELVDLAEELGITVKTGLLVGALGSCNTDGTRVTLASTDAAVLFHELGHAVDARLHGKLTGGQHEDQETVAELASAVLMELYGYEDRTGNAWQYISMYADNPIAAVYRAMGKVGEIVTVISEAG